jgi:trans-aconitate methyltransferase
MSVFDSYAADYDAALMRGVAVSGEDKLYFAQKRVAWTAHRLREMQIPVSKVMDFGCGTGSSIPYLLEFLAPASVTGLDVSAGSLQIAEQTIRDSRVTFQGVFDHTPNADIDLAFCNGVFHHIPLAERPAAVEHIWKSLRPGGFFAFWENNPWNPGARLVMARIPFDRDAIMVSAPEARRLLQARGLVTRRTDFQFVFPRCLSVFRRFEPVLAPLPLGAQYLVLAQKV